MNTPQFEVVRKRLAGHPQPVPPIYQPEVIGRAAVHVVLDPKRESWIGWSTIKAIIGQRLVPGYLDRYLARAAWEPHALGEQLVSRLARGGGCRADGPGRVARVILR